MTKWTSLTYIFILLFACTPPPKEGDGNPFVGQWELDLAQSDPPLRNQFKNVSPHLMSITALGSDGLTIAYPKSGTSCDGTFDGKENECRGPGVPEGFTMSLKMISPDELSYSAGTQSGNRSTGTLKVSEDGLILTQVSQPGGLEKPVKAVYQKQL